jgi:3-deoxy-D-manno-octulosonate 8-phosphate phosphatase (KDO 8-P phosphatase)
MSGAIIRNNLLLTIKTLPLLEPYYLALLKTATAIVMDVDGVLTDSSVLIMENGDQLRNMSIRDGYALQLAMKKGLTLAVITGGKSEGVVKRLNGLGIQHVNKNSDDKISALNNLVKELNVDLQTTVYIGDDMPDLEAMKLCGIPCCPTDACIEVIGLSKYVSPFKGGHGCVRDIIEKILKLQNKWQ